LAAGKMSNDPNPKSNVKVKKLTERQIKQRRRYKNFKINEWGDSLKEEVSKRQRIYTRITGPMPFQCKACHKKFKIVTEVESHMKTCEVAKKNGRKKKLKKWKKKKKEEKKLLDVPQVMAPKVDFLVQYELEKTINNLREQLEESEAKNKKIQNKLDKNKATCVGYQEMLQKQQNKYQELDTKCGILQKKLQAAEADNQKLQSFCHELKGQKQ